MFLGFFAWYSGLARAGIARAGQLQLAQPFLTIGIAALVLGKRPSPITYAAGAVVLACLVIAQRARFGRSRTAPGPDMRPAERTRGRTERVESQDLGRTLSSFVGTSISNTGSVSSSTFDPQLANNTSTDVTR